jgi:transcription-repair coupling factor (superfamily II helicase)
LPAEVETLFAVASLRVTCERLGVMEVSTYKDQVRVKPVDLPSSLELELPQRVAKASYHRTTRTLNLTPDRIAGTELPAWVEQQLMRATGAEEAVARMAG